MTNKDLWAIMLKQIARLFLFPASLLLSVLAASADTRLAVGTFGLAPETRDTELADLLGVRLSAAPGFQVVERRELKAALTEASMSLSGVTRAKDAVRVGGMVRADQFLLGSSMRLQGTNILVVRLVDARKGTMRDVHVFVDSGSVEALAAEIEAFVGEAEKHAPTQRRDYLAVGVVQNLGVNDRFSDFPAQMRGHIAANLGGKVTLLERDVVSFLADEIRLDMTGLTGQDPEHIAQMQFGFWIVDGFYQSYEVNEPEVELKLRVEHVLGGQQNYTLQGKPDAAFFKNICDSIIKTLDNPPVANPALTASRQGEIAALEARGRQLVDYLGPAPGGRPSIVQLRSEYNRDKAMNILDEATRVFQSILLLDPTNNTVKMRLAACLLSDEEKWGGVERPDKVGRTERAKECYRDVIASGDNGYAPDARIGLAYAYGGFDGVVMLHRFAKEADDKETRKLMQSYETGPMMWPLTHELPTETLMPFFRDVLLERLKDTLEDSNTTVSVNYQPVLFPYRFNPEQRAKIISELLPDLIRNFPRLEPYLLLEAAGEQVTTNSPVTAQFLASLKTCEAYPESIWQPNSYFRHLSSTFEDERDVAGHGGTTLLQRTFANHQFITITNMVLARQRAAERGFAPPVTDEGKRLLAESYMALEHWKEALTLLNDLPDVPEHMKNECRNHLKMALENEELPEPTWKDKADEERIELAYDCIGRKDWQTAISILDSIGHRIVRMNSAGAWGYAFTPVLPAVVAAECRVKAGEPPRVDPMIFEIDPTPYVYFPSGGAHTFAVEAEGEDLWVATYSEFSRFQGPGPIKSLNPTEMHKFRRTTHTGSTCICVCPDFVWAGTEDEGLFELDRKTGTIRHFTMSEGLLLNGICSLTLEKDNLWIGYKNGQNGALGRMNISTHKFSSLTARLSPGAGTNSQPYWDQTKLDDPNQPPQHPVTSMAEVEPGEMWFAVANTGVQRYRSTGESWSTLNSVAFPGVPLSIGGIAVDQPLGEVLLATTGPKERFAERSGMGGLIFNDFRNYKRNQMLVDDGLPSNDVTAVACDGKLAWVGGRGFVAIIDVQQRRVLRIAYISASRILKLQLGKEYAWIQVSCARQDAWPDYSGNAETGVYRIERASVEPRL